MAVRYFTKEHEWVSIDGQNATVGITDFAQKRLGDIVFVELPASGRTVSQGQETAVVESVKAASDVYAPISGLITGSNPKLEHDPGLINRAAESDGWFFRVTLTNPDELNTLMDQAAYAAFIATIQD